MLFQRYEDFEAFKSNTFEALLENEAQNNLLLGVMTDGKAKRAADSLMATVVDDGRVIIAAFWSKPLNLLLYEAENSPPGALELLTREILKLDIDLPGVLTKRGLSQRFADAYRPDSGSILRMSMTIMRLDKLAEYKKASGFCRVLDERDMYFVPFWERAFSEDCRVQVFSIPENVERIKTRLGKNSHFIWEDGAPVSQAVYGRDTPNGAVINWVYTPPNCRGRGYATSVVAELSRDLLDRGKRFCCLFADADNETSCSLYRKLGFYDVCTYEDIQFDTGHKIM